MCSNPPRSLLGHAPQEQHAWDATRYWHPEIAASTHCTEGARTGS